MKTVIVTDKGDGRYFQGIGQRREGEEITTDETTADQLVKQGFCRRARTAKSDNKQ